MASAAEYFEGLAALSAAGVFPDCGGVRRGCVSRGGGPPGVGLSLAAARRLTKMKLDGARLPREASPAKVAKDGQHTHDDDDDPQDRHVILSLGARTDC
jgi:hypothetical protein